MGAMTEGVCRDCGEESSHGITGVRDGALDHFELCETHYHSRRLGNRLVDAQPEGETK